MHHLTPEFILINADKGRSHGQFPGVALFADISGFTPLTAALMTHGQEGAETIAAVLSAVFDPLVEIVYARGGFIAGFAGDAFKAIFPLVDDGAPDNARYRAVDAAWRICAHMRDHRTHQTRFGAFDFDVTLCLADGNVTWEILSDRRQDDPGIDEIREIQRAGYLIEGDALSCCLALDPDAETGHVTLSSALVAQLDPATVETEAATHFARLVAVKHPPSHDATAGLTVQPGRDVDRAFAAQARRFHPNSLLSLETQGEFRRVVTLFFDLQTLPDPDQRPAFEAEFFRLLHQYDGYLGRVGRAGDWGSAATFLLFWGAPTSHENDIQRALDFALSLLAACPTPARAGITANIAYAGFVGGARHEEYTCYGNYVNLAARQTKSAGWGEIWLDRETARQAEGTFTVESLGARRFKGIQEAQPIFRLQARADDGGAQFYANALIGRRQDLVRLARACAPIFAGRFGGVITVVGEAGMGKSRLTHEFQQQLVDERATGGRAVSWFRCQTDEILRQPLNPFRYFLRHYFGQAGGSGEGERKRRFEARLDELVAATNDEMLRNELRRVHSFLGALVDLRWNDSLYEQLDPRLRFENTLAALKTLFKAESMRHPLIIQVEDAHWLDPESITFLGRLLRNVAQFPFIVIATTRPPQADRGDADFIRSLPANAPNTTVNLTPLADDQLGALVTDFLGGQPSPSLLKLLDQRADGNPFFIEQILLYLNEQGLLERRSLGWAMRTDGDVDQTASAAILSGDARAVLTARLDRLEPPVREVVQTAAVLGREFDQRVLAQMMRQDPRLPHKLETASEAAIWSAVEQARYMFRHALLRDAAYDMQLRSRLRSLHRAAAAAIERVHAQQLAPHYADLAHHYRQGEEQRAERKYAALAGDYAASQYANQEAARHFERALALIDDDQLADRYDIALKAEGVYGWMGDHKRQRQQLDFLLASAESLEDAHRRALAQLRASHYQRMINDYPAALHAIRAAVADAQRAGDVQTSAEAHHAWGRLLRKQGRYGPARRRLDAALVLYREQEAAEGEAAVLYDYGVVGLYQGDFETARRYGQRAHAIYRQLASLPGQVHCLDLFGMLAQESGQYEEAQRHQEEALALCRTIGLRRAERRILASMGNIRLELGDYSAALRYHDQVLAACREAGDQDGEALSLDVLSLLACLDGDPDEAIRHGLEALAIQESIGDERFKGYTFTYLGHAHGALGDWEASRRHHQQALDARRALGEESRAIDNLAGLALAEMALGRLEEARTRARQTLAWIQEHGLGGAEFPAQIYLRCYQVLATGAAPDMAPDMADARRALEAGQALVRARAAAITDPRLRRLYLTNVPFNREIMALA